jgi:tRNA A-37 threonylcarbamoyl transferase component Bud32
VSPAELERSLADLPSIGRLVKEQPYRQVWRFEFAGKPYYLKFYPRHAGKLKRLIRGSPALREFLNLQAMQRAGIPSPRAVAHLSGFMLRDVKGDAVILEGIEPAVQLDHYVSDLALRGERPPNHRDLARQIIAIVQKLGQAKLGHSDLHLGNFLLHEGKLSLLDGYAIHGGGMRKRDVMLLGHSVSRFATKGDLLRAWRIFSDGPLPLKNPMRRRLWRKQLEAAFGANRFFGQLTTGEWAGQFFKHAKFPRRWAPASGIDISAEDWHREWPKLLARLEADDLEILKRSPSGDVLAGELTLSGRTVPVVIKRSRRRKWRRYFTEIGRGGRARRAWRKAWALVARDVPTAWPLLMMEQRRMGYVTDSLIVSERVSGTMLVHLDLTLLNEADRQTLFHRLGRTLRNLESMALSQYDSKMTNWIIVDDPKRGPVPVAIDVDGIRRWTPPQWPIDRLLRSLREHPQYTPEDSRWVCIGYAPYARLIQEDPVQPPSPLVGEGGGEGEEVQTHSANVRSLESAPSPPHPNPLPQGERGPDDNP